jgi:hypothetical protein
LENSLSRRRLGSINLLLLENSLTRRKLELYLLVAVGDAFNKKEVRIPLTGCRWRFNYQEGG